MKLMTSPDTSDCNDRPEKSGPSKPMKREPQPQVPEKEDQERENPERKLKSARRDRTRVTIAPSTDPGPDIQIGP
jgi:hypothetical protein